MKIHMLKIVGAISSIFLSVHAQNAHKTLERMHQRLNKALESTSSISACQLLKNNGTVMKDRLEQGPLILDIQEVNGVKLIKGVKRENSLMDKLFWCKQDELVQQLQSNPEYGYTLLVDLLAKRCMHSTNLLLSFMHEIVLEDQALNCCQQDARDTEIEQLKRMRSMLDALLECLTKTLGIRR